MRCNPNYDSKNDNLFLASNQNNLIEGTQNFILPPRQTNILICQSCFWCASYLYGSCKVPERCPTCGNSNNNNIESIPISKEEAFEFEYNLLRGLSLNFLSHKKSR
jgi:hypothetical protein